MVELFVVEEKNDMTNITYNGEVLFAVPRDAFVFQDVLYSRDHHLQSSFRHEMMIPNDMMPKAWMNQ